MLVGILLFIKDLLVYLYFLNVFTLAFKIVSRTCISFGLRWWEALLEQGQGWSCVTMMILLIGIRKVPWPLVCCLPIPSPCGEAATGLPWDGNRNEDSAAVSAGRPTGVTVDVGHHEYTMLASL